MTPQHFCNIIVNYVNAKCGYFNRIKNMQFTENDVYNYCIQHSESLDKGDIDKIRFLVRETLSLLAQSSHLSFCNGIYEAKKPVINKNNFTIFDKPHKMRKYTTAQIQRLNSIDISFSNDPTLK